MNKTEQLGYEWLKKQGYKNKDIKFNVNKSPDFICSDGKRYEVKKLYGIGIELNKIQIRQFKNNDIILIFDAKKLIKKFLWKNRKKQKFHLWISKIKKDRVCINISKNTQKTLLKLKKYTHESYEDIIKRILKLNKK